MSKMGYLRKDKRGCDIFLYRRHIGGLVAWHWALAFWWDDDYIETYEADKEGSYLRLNWFAGKPDSDYDWKEWGRYRCDDCSPVQVTHTAENLPCVDSPYNVYCNNCQDFAKSLARKFGVTSLPPGINKVVRTTLTFGLDNILLDH